MNEALPVPAPPAGPGVRVPFAAPPADRDRKRLWISLGVGGAVLLLCCVGGVGGLGALAVASEKAAPAEAKGVVRLYLDGLSKRDFKQAYDQVCTSRQDGESLAQFTSEQQGRPRVRSFQVEEPTLQSGGRFTVPAEVETVDGSSGTEDYTVIQDRQAGEMRVCGGPR
jgi:hypothetical protein